MTEAGQMDLASITEDAPCGPDLDASGDPEFMNFLAAYEGQLPDSFFSFDRANLDFSAALATAAKLRKRTHDLRLLLLSAKLSLLNRDFYAFARGVSDIAWLLRNRWEETHPQAERGRFGARLAQLGTLNDSPVVVLPLQYATLLQTDREGPLNYRAIMVSAGDAKLREGEKLPSAPVIERLLANVELDALDQASRALRQLHADLDAIGETTAEKLGAAEAVKFDALSPLVVKMAEFAQTALARRDPSLAPTPPSRDETIAEADETNTTAFQSLADVDAALAGALGYFLAREPSSPALLLIAQARATLGKNLFDVMRLLAPRHAENARVFVGPADAFAIPVSNLRDAPAPDFTQGEAPAAPSRSAAFALVEQAAAHLRAAEPSSPAPYLLDRARTLAARDFLSLLGDVFPEDDLDSMRKGN